MIRIYLNNYATTLTAELSDQAPFWGRLSFADEAPLLSALSRDSYVALTLQAGDNVEIIHVVKSNNALALADRAKDGTLERTWPAGTKAICAVTASSFSGLAAYHHDDAMGNIDNVYIPGIYHIQFTLMGLPPNTPNGGQLIVSNYPIGVEATQDLGVSQTIISDYIGENFSPCIGRREWKLNEANTDGEWTPWVIYPLVPMVS